jgi:benzylsuccinate CoA-transferase BbsF subunit
MLEATTALMSEPMSSFRATGHSPGPAGNGSPWFAPHGIYACAGEDRWIAIECREEADWGALLTVLGAEKLADDRRFATLARRLEHVAELDCQIGGRTRERERHELAEELQDAGVAAVPVLDVADLFADPHLAERGWWIDFDQPGLGRFRAHGPIARLERTPARLRLRPPQLGEHTAELKPVRT